MNAPRPDAPLDNRFGVAVYVSDDAATSVNELRAHDQLAARVLRERLDLSKAKVVDFTDPEVAREFGYSEIDSYKWTQRAAEAARARGYNVIKYESVRGSGTNYAVLDNFNDLLKVEANLAPADAVDFGADAVGSVRMA